MEVAQIWAMGKLPEFLAADHGWIAIVGKDLRCKKFIYSISCNMHSWPGGRHCYGSIIGAKMTQIHIGNHCPQLW